MPLHITYPLYWHLMCKKPTHFDTQKQKKISLSYHGTPPPPPLAQSFLSLALPPPPRLTNPGYTNPGLYTTVTGIAKGAQEPQPCWMEFTKEIERGGGG